MADRSEHRSPFEGVTDFFSELNRMRDVGRGHEHPHETKERTHASAWVPATDILARGEDLVVRVELAGVDPSDVNLHFSGGVLVVSGARRSGLEEGVDFYIRERYYGEFRRAITLPDGVDPGDISAEFDDGLVEITVRHGVRPSDSTRIALADRSEPPTTRGVS